MKLSIIKDNTNWLEATWYEEAVTENEGSEQTTKTQIHCESFSGHPEHIAMLRDKAATYGTSLDEFEDLITEAESKFVPEPESKPSPNLRIYEIKEELSALDTKRIRPMAEGDTEYLAVLNAQAVVLREELQILLNT